MKLIFPAALAALLQLNYAYAGVEDSKINDYAQNEEYRLHDDAAFPHVTAEIKKRLGLPDNELLLKTVDFEEGEDVGYLTIFSPKSFHIMTYFVIENGEKRLCDGDHVPDVIKQHRMTQDAPLEPMPNESRAKSKGRFAKAGKNKDRKNSGVVYAVDKLITIRYNKTKESDIQKFALDHAQFCQCGKASSKSRRTAGLSKGQLQSINEHTVQSIPGNKEPVEVDNCARSAHSTQRVTLNSRNQSSPRYPNTSPPRS